MADDEASLREEVNPAVFPYTLRLTELNFISSVSNQPYGTA
jgi:hypothetical protein